MFVGVEEKAGIDKGILNAIPSVSAFAIDARFVKVDMLNSVSRAPDMGSNCANTNKLHFRNGGIGRDDLDAPLLPWSIDWATFKI